jgi:ABC-2 type transport system ATP-binding protein
VVVFLDEPTDGVDPQGRIDFKHIIASLRDEGRTVFVNSHLLAEVEQVADRVAILSKGRIIQQGLVADLTRRDARYEIRYLGEIPASLRDWCLQRGMDVSADRITCRADDALAVQPLIDQLRAALVVIREIKEERYSLEELFLQAVSQARADRPPALPPKGGAP